MHDRSKTTYLIRSLALVVGSILINIGLGYLVRDGLQWPLYLDLLGTVLVGALLGPLAGAAVGAVSTIIWGGLLGDPSVLPYTISAAFIGWAAGYAAWRGAFRRFGTVLLAGLLTGVGAALISAPITAYVLGDITGGGTDYLTSYLTATGANVLQAATLQGFISDPLDKTLTFAGAWLLWRVLQPYFRPLSQRGTKAFDTLQGYSVAVVASLVASLLSFVFLPAFERSIFTVFYIAVLISAWRGGLGPALLTTAVGAFANIAFLETAHYSVGINAQDWLRVGHLRCGVVDDCRHRQPVGAEQAPSARVPGSRTGQQGPPARCHRRRQRSIGAGLARSAGDRRQPAFRGDLRCAAGTSYRAASRGHPHAV